MANLDPARNYHEYLTKEHIPDKYDSFDQNTLEIVLDAIGQKELPVKKTWRLNERHYGGLTGLNKAETAAKHGEEQVKIWRRSFDVPPPKMEKDHPYYDTIVNDPR